MAVEFRDAAANATAASPLFDSSLPVGPIDVEEGDFVVLDVFASPAASSGQSATFNSQPMTLLGQVPTLGPIGSVTGTLYRYLYEATSTGSFSASYFHPGSGRAAAVLRSYSGVGFVGGAQFTRGSGSTPAASIDHNAEGALVVHAFGGGAGGGAGGTAITVTTGATHRLGKGNAGYCFVATSDTDADATVGVSGSTTASQWVSLAHEFWPVGVEPPIPEASGAIDVTVTMTAESQTATGSLAASVQVHGGVAAARNTVAVYEVAGTVAFVIEDPPPPAVYIWTQESLDPTLAVFDYHTVPYPAALTQMGESVAQGAARLSNYIANTQNDFILVGTSQGSGVVHEVYKELLPGGELEEHYDRLLGVVTFGSMRRPEGHTFPGCPDPGGRGADAGRLVEDPPDYWWDFCRPGDPVCAMPDTYEGAYYSGTVDGYQEPRVWAPRHEGWGAPASPDAGIAILLAFANNHSYFGTWQPLAAHGDSRSEIQIAQDYIYSLVEESPPALEPNAPRATRIKHLRNGFWHEVNQ